MFIVNKQDYPAILIFAFQDEPGRYLYRIKKYVLAVILMIAGLSAFAQNKIQIVSFLNSSATNNLVDIYLDSDLILNDIHKASASSFLDLLPGKIYQVSVAPSTSASVNDTVYSMSFYLIQDEQYVIAFSGEVGNGGGVAHMFEPTARTIATEPGHCDISFSNLADGKDPIDMVYRQGGMIFGDLGYGESTLYLPFDTIEHYVDVKYTGTTNIIATYRLSLEGYPGQAFKVYALGNPALSYGFQLFAVYGDGFVVPVDYAPLARVQYFNTLPDTVDIYKNGTRFSDNATPGGAMPYKNIPADFNFNIAVCPWTSINSSSPFGVFPFIFENNKTYSAVTAGTLTNPNYPLEMFFTDGRMESAPVGRVGITFFNGVYGHPGLDLSITGAGADKDFGEVSYGSFTGYTWTDSAAFDIVINAKNSANDEVVFAQPVDLSGFAGQSVTYFFTRLAGVDSNYQGIVLWEAKPDGNTRWLVTVGLPQISKNTGWNIYPNPVSGGTLFIQIPENEDGQKNWRLRNAAMQIVAEGRVDDGYTGVLPVSIEVPVSGLYYFEMMDSVQKHVQPIFIQKP